MELTHCPECGQPAEIDDRFILESTGGPVEHARVRCLVRHVFVLPLEWLAREVPSRAADALGPGPSAPLSPGPRRRR